MKIKLLDRIISAVLALILLCCAAGIIAQMFFGIPVADKVSAIIKNPDSILKKAVLIGSFVILLLLAVYCFSVLFRHKKKNTRFLSQTTEGGELDISLEALSNLVNKCIEQHPEVQPEKIILDNEKNSLSVRIIGNVAGGISIPLTVSQLQKQIKQYVTACSGVEVKEVKVTVRSSGEDAKDAPFAIEAPAMVPRLKASADESGEMSEKKTENIPAPDTHEKPVQTVQTPENTAPIFPKSPENDDDFSDDGRPLHQRIFSQPEELCYVPGPETAFADSEQDLSENTESDTDTENTFTTAEDDISEEDQNITPNEEANESI